MEVRFLAKNRLDATVSEKGKPLGKIEVRPRGATVVGPKRKAGQPADGNHEARVVLLSRLARGLKQAFVP